MSASLDIKYNDKLNKLINDIKKGFAKLDAYIIELEQDY